MDSRQLRAFATVAQAGGYRPAAAQLHLTQSALTHAIQALERDLGCRLFYKQGKKSTLTRAGERLREQAAEIFALMARARADAASDESSAPARLRVGCSRTLAQFVLPTVLREFRESFPATRVAVLSCPPLDGPGTLAAGGMDLLLGLQPPERAGFTSRLLFTDRPCLLASRLVTRPAELKAEPWILPLDAAENGLQPRNAESAGEFQLEDLAVIKEMVKLGLGVTVEAPWVAARELAEGSLRALPLRPALPIRRWTATVPTHRPPTLAEGVFIGLCRNVCLALRREPQPDRTTKQRTGRTSGARK